jgi:predicted DNA-binding protein with PD1-like motif
MTIKPAFAEFKQSRMLIGRLPHGKDIIQSIEAVCKEYSIKMATFSLIGAVSSAVIGSYDQSRKVYDTFKLESQLEIVSCTGNVSIKEGQPFVHAHIMLADEKGKTFGGHLFSESTVFAAELHLMELSGKPMQRTHDATTGLMLWG